MEIRAQNPSGQTVIFDSEYHTFHVEGTGQKLTGATSFIGKFFPKFDADAAAKMCIGKPKYAGMTTDEIKAQWAAKGEQSRDNGHAVHGCLESLAATGDLRYPPGITTDSRVFRLICQGVSALVSLLKRFEFIEAEKIVFSPELGVAGIIDLLMRDREADEVVILDWKQNEKIGMDNRWERGLPPIDHIEACDYNKYALQLSLYETILLREQYFITRAYRRAIIHLTEDAYRPIKMPDLHPVIYDMLNHRR